ncbi:PO21 protein, partial [Indicator maculatus]|nr:PO21 protein [Indicator maculatus]
KAFNSVNHTHILKVLEQKCLDDHIVALIKDLYDNIHTVIKIKDGQSDSIWTRTGVKQGNPMSSLLFNLCIDPLSCTLEELGNGFDYDKAKITTLAFADDLVLLSSSWSGMNKNIEILEALCELTGLKTQGEK